MSEAAQGPLHGMRVVEVASAIVGPLAGLILGDMGADVIHVETPQGDNNRLNGHARNPKMAAMFLGINRNKRSLVLDLNTPAGREALMRLLETADVFISSMRRKAMAKRGLDYASVAARNPRIIYAFSPGYRTDGPYGDRPAYDDIIQGHCGVAGAIERANGEARYMPTDLTGKLCGYILASSIAMALYERTISGQGQQIEVPMMENATAFMLWEHMWGHAFDPPAGPIGYNRLFTAHRRPLPTLDGHICLLAITDEQWKRLLEAIGLSQSVSDGRFASLERRTENVDALYEMVSRRFATLSTAEWIERLDAADIPCAPMNNLEDLPEDPYLKATGFFERYEHPTEGPLVRTPVTVHFSDTPARIRLPAPTLGQHSAEILGELGYDDMQAAEIGRVS